MSSNFWILKLKFPTNLWLKIKDSSLLLLEASRKPNSNKINKIFPCWILWESPLICQIMVVNLFVYLNFLKCSTALQFLVFTPWEFVVDLHCRSYIELSTRLVRIIWVRVQNNPIYYPIFFGIWTKKSHSLFPLIVIAWIVFSSAPEYFISLDIRRCLI